MNNLLEFPKRGKIEAEAAEWLIVLDRDSPPTPDERQQLKQWLNTSSAHRKAIKDLAELWGQINILTRLAVELDLPNTAGSSSGLTLSNLQFRVIGVALAMLLLAVSLLLSLGANRAFVKDTNGYYSTVLGEVKSEDLNDGSVVALNSASGIEVSFSSRYRDIYLLQGEAHFIAANDKERLFRVFADGVLVTATGTAFSVSVESGSVDVLVLEGSVSLEMTASRRLKNIVDREGSLIQDRYAEDLAELEAGQVATVYAQGEEPSDMVKIRALGIERVTDKLSWREGVLTFTGQFLENVIEQVGDYTGVELTLAHSSLSQMRIYGQLPVGKSEMMLEALEPNFGLQVIWTGLNRAVISTSGFELSEPSNYSDQKPLLDSASQD